MELNHDWRGFQSIFHPNRKSSLRHLRQEFDSMVYLVVDGTLVVSACGADGEDVSAWFGKNISEVTAQVPHRELVLFTRKEVDEWMNGCLKLPHFYEQMEYLRRQSVPEAISTQGMVSRVRPVVRRHFLLEAIQGWWRKVLPSAYGIYIRLENGIKRSEDIFLLVRRGRLELFHAPDFSVLGADRMHKPEAVVKYLSEKHMVPVQGFWIPAEDWSEWSTPDQTPAQANSWKQFAVAVRKNRVKMVPFRWQVAALGATRAFLNL